MSFMLFAFMDEVGSVMPQFVVWADRWRNHCKFMSSRISRILSRFTARDNCLLTDGATESDRLPKARKQLEGGTKLADHPVRLATAPLYLLVVLTVSSCSTTHAYRKASIAWDNNFSRPAECDDEYAFTDDLIATEFHLSESREELERLRTTDSTTKTRKKLDKEIGKRVTAANADASHASCWATSYENHQGLSAVSHQSEFHRNHGLQSSSDARLLQAPGYDLFFAEFDDEGERTDVAHDGVKFEKSQVALIESRLTSMLKEEKGPQGGGLNIVLFTHGWHGTASASNEYSTWFKAILEQIAFMERTTRGAGCYAQTSLTSGAMSGRVAPCVPGKPEKQRRTVGVEIAWRGDSFEIPYLNLLDFWDRKSAAQTAARGAVSDLMARLQRFYLQNKCQVTTAPAKKDLPVAASDKVENDRCDAVHMLTIGHSFGALMDYHSLSNDIGSGVLADDKGRAYGFGDLTILLNPAYEGERETTLIESSIHHPAYPNTISAAESEKVQQTGSWPSGAQMPTLVTLQSEGDWATHYAFPAVRLATGILENTSGHEELSRSISASGWVGYYYTHRLTTVGQSGKDTCTGHGEALTWFCPFDMEGESDVVHPLHLCKPAANDDDKACDRSGLTEFPEFAPLWTVRVDKAIMKDHDDIADPAVVRFMALLFRAAYTQEELLSSH